MSSVIRHGNAVKPISIPSLADVNPDNWDRVQSFGIAVNQPTEKLYELGYAEKIATAKEILEASVSINQLEYGSIDAFLQLAGLSAEPVAGLALSDFNESKTDFYLPGKTTYGGIVEETVWLQKMVLDSFTIEMNAEERIQRTFEMSGNFCKIARGANKCLVFKTDTVGSGEAGTFNIVLSDPAPVVSPNQAGTYILQLVRIRAGVATELSSGYTYTSGTTTLAIANAEDGDVYRIWYTAGGYGTAGDPFVFNSSDDYYIKADNVTVTIDDGVNTPVVLDKLTTLSINATLNRLDQAVIGSNEKLLREVESYDVTMSLGGFVKNFPIQEALMLQAGQNWGLIDYTLFSNVTIIVKVYEDATKSTFKIGFKSTAMDYTDDSQTYNANEYAESPVTLAGTNLLITEVEGLL